MAEYKKSPDRSASSDAQPWLEKISGYKNNFQKWKDQRENLDKVYSKDSRADSADREYSIFWANLEVLKPATYARPPVPVVAPRFKDGNTIARNASELLERCLVVTFEQADIDGCMIEVRDEFLRYARGTAWARLTESEQGGAKVEFDHVTADDFAHDCARTWREVSWGARCAHLTREAGIARFGEKFRSVPLKKRDANAKNYDRDDTAPVWEIWDRKTRKVVWVAEDHAEVLDVQEPFLNLSGFFPFPRPAYGTLVPKTLRPVPEVRQYKDQIEEINEYTARIAALSESLRMKGFYPAGAGDISEAIETAMKSMEDRALLVPISSFAGLGGSSPKDIVIWWPVRDVMACIDGLVNLRRILIEDVYQITGISDIIRGSTDPRETKGAQQLKSQWGSLRIRERQRELVRFARDLTRIAAEILAENGDVQSLLKMSQLSLPTQAQKAEAMALVQKGQALAQAGQPAPEMPPQLQAMLEKPAIEEVAAFLKDDQARGFIIEIETDSTIQPDEDAEKQRRMEFVTAIGGLVQQVVPQVMQVPQIGPFLVEAIKFAAAGFRAGRPMEATIDKIGGMVEQLAKQPQGEKPPSPEILKAQAEQQKAMLEGQARAQEIAASAAAREQEFNFREREHQFRLLELQRQEEFDRAKHDRETAKRAAKEDPAPIVIPDTAAAA